MLKFGFTIAVIVINTIINDPVGVCFWVDIDTPDKTDALDDALFATAPLSANRFNRFRIEFWQHRIVKKQVSIFIKLNIGNLHRFPEFTGREVLIAQQTIELIMTPFIAMIRKLRLRKVLETCCQKMAIIRK